MRSRVGKLASKVRRWWRAQPRTSAVRAPFRIPCPCGQVATGFRKARHQVVTCVGCGAGLFVLPLSPLPPVGAADAPSPAAPARPAPGWRPWALPLLATLLTLAALVAVYLLVVVPWLRGTPPHTPGAAEGPATDAAV